MITLRTWKITACAADLFIVVLFIVQVLPHGSIHNQVFDYSPGRASIDIVVCPLIYCFTTILQSINSCLISLSSSLPLVFIRISSSCILISN